MHSKKKFLLIMRHAKSDRSLAFANDFERPLNDRGHHQPKTIAKRLNQLNLNIDKALVSPARRTVETWNLLKKHLLKHPEPKFDLRLYNAFCDQVIQVLSEDADESRCLLLIAHCPAVAEVCELLTGEVHDFKTASVAILSTDSEQPFSNLLKPKRFHFDEMIVADE